MAKTKLEQKIGNAVFGVGSAGLVIGGSIGAYVCADIWNHIDVYNEFYNKFPNDVPLGLITAASLLEVFLGSAILYSMAKAYDFPMKYLRKK